MRSPVRRRILRFVVAALAAVSLSVGFLEFPAHSRGAGVATQSSVNVAVVPGFTAPTYPGYNGVGKFPAGNSRLSAYHFSELSASKLTASGLGPYDTVILYGIRWSTISASGQAALNAFAATHKVLIWDSDGTGSQNYGTFIHPFSTLASGASGNPAAPVVTFPGGVNFLASDNPSSPYYLDPAQLISNASMINDMNVMQTGTKNWLPSLIAENKNIPHGGWVLAWSYGVIGNHTGLTVYSGLDADAIDNPQLNPNDEITELGLQLKAPFSTTPDPSCAPGCGLPGQGSGGGGTGGGGSTHAACSFAKRVPVRWVHGRVPIWLKTSVGAGITGRVLSPKGRTLASAKERGGDLHFRVRTQRLRTNHASQLRALVFVNGQQACGMSFRLKVDNTPPRLLYLRTRTAGHSSLVSFRVSETSAMRIAGGPPRYRHWVLVTRKKLIDARLPGRVRHARLILRDRAGNILVRKLAW